MLETLIAATVSAILAVVPSQPDPDLLAPSEYIRQLGNEDKAAWIEDGALHCATRVAADSVTLVGAVQQPLTEIEDGLWVGSFELERIEEAVLSALFVVTVDGNMNTGGRVEEIRGPDAPPPIQTAAELRGRVTKYEIGAELLGSAREVQVYLPPNAKPTEVRRVVYMTDGTALDAYARVLEPMILAGDLPPTALIGVASGPRDPADPTPTGDGRAIEYLKGAFDENDGVDLSRFDRHWAFFTQWLPEWTRTELGLNVEPRDRYAFGFSNGGAFVATLAALAPDTFGGVISCSLGLPYIAEWFEPIQGDGPQPRVFFSAGLYEANFRAQTTKVFEAARAAGRQTTMDVRVGGHDQLIWMEQFARGLRWLEANRPRD